MPPESFTGLTATPDFDHAKARRLLLREGFYSEAFTALTGGAFLTGMALYLGAGPVALSLLFALPLVGQAAQVVAPYLEAALQTRRGFVVPALIVGRALWAIPALLVLFGARGQGALLLSLLATFALALVTMVGINGWTAWMSEVIPTKHRASLFGARAWAVAASTLIAAPLCAWLLDMGRDAGVEGPVLGAIGLLAVGCGVAGALVLKGFPDMPPMRLVAPNPLGLLQELYRDDRYRRVWKTFVSWNFAVGIPYAFWAKFMLTELRMSFFLVVLHTMVVLLVRLACNGAWARLIDRYGNQAVLVFSAFGCSVIPLIWTQPRPDFLIPVWVDAVVAGIFWTGFNQAAFIQPMLVTRAETRSMGLALFHAGVGISCFLGTVLGGAVMEVVSDWGREGYYVLFLSSSALRAASGLYGRRLVPDNVRLRGVAQHFFVTGWLERPIVGRTVFVGREQPGHEGEGAGHEGEGSGRKGREAADDGRQVGQEGEAAGIAKRVVVVGGTCESGDDAK